MIDPTQSLAFSLSSTPGAYALLLGSGISQAAGIPTGWEITLELVRKLALLNGEEPVDSEEWYKARYGKAPDYAQILDAVAKTPSERQQLLRSYWEANEDERERKLKQPTLAHRRIADLVSMNTIKVIITTNFDRLLEVALADVGIVPTVISTVDQIQGAMPLIHCRCCIVKVHGDYLDTRILNTPQELASYEPELNRLLDRIFDEFGVIVCGWSAEWDVALRAAITRAPSRRFAFYWAARGKLGGTASTLCTHRAGTVVPIENADAFFAGLHASVKSLHEFAKPHPISKEMALANLRQYVSKPTHVLQLEDLVLSEAEKAKKAIENYAFPMKGEVKPDVEGFTYRIEAYQAATETLVAMAALGGYWALPSHTATWGRALEILHEPGDSNGAYRAWLGASNYPSIVLFYALGLAAVSAENFALIAALFSIQTKKDYRESTLVEQLPPACAFDDSHGPAQLLKGYQHCVNAMNNFLHDRLRHLFKRVHPQDKGYDRAFDKFEILVSLAFLWRGKRDANNFWTPPGRWLHHSDNRDVFYLELAKSLSEKKELSPYADKLFGDGWADSFNRLTLLREKAPSRFAQWYL